MCLRWTTLFGMQPDFFLFKSYRYNNYTNKNLNLNYIVIVKCDLHGEFAKICN